MSSAFDKVRRVYTGLSLILLNTFFLLIIVYALLELISGWLLKRYSSTVDTATSSVVEAGYSGRAWKEQYFQDAAAYQVSSEGRKVFEPYSMWKNPDFSSATLNVVNGYRKTINPAHYSNDSLIKVFVLGASTLFCIEVPDEYTIASQISKHLHQTFPDKKFEVSSYGASGFVNEQEAILLSKLLIEGKRPDIVIFYDGANDTRMQVGMSRPIPHAFFEMYDQIFRSIKERLWANMVWKSSLLTLVMKYRTDEGKFEQDSSILRPRAEKIAQRYSNTVTFVNSLAKTYGFQLAFFWQPTLLTSKKQMPPAEKSLYDLSVKQFGPCYSIMEEIIDSTIFNNPLFPHKDIVFNIRTALDSQTNLVYLDSVHLTAEGNDHVAEVIVKTLQNRLYIR
jgi:lysophospholipase L1-like esterase